MRYLLDTNVVIALLNDTLSKPARRLRREKHSDIAVSSIVLHELYFGACKSARVAGNLAVVDALQFSVLDFDKEDARNAGRIRADLKDRGIPIEAYDVLIAGQALARNLVLVTHNKREFRRVSGLRTEDWES